jgi:diacylglycerol kinase family enzyme
MCALAVLGKMPNDKDVELLSGSHFTIKTTPSIPVQLDGNETGIVTPVEIEVLQRAIQVVVGAKP